MPSKVCKHDQQNDVCQECHSDGSRHYVLSPMGGTDGYSVINLVIAIDWPQDQKHKVQVVVEQSHFTNGSLSTN